ncbi:dTDP-4-amino-4,6-dideoxygalactose transaminase [Vibrio chagasii]|uniref:dTDP-4-amino-4,6-dideoxygalactose transaminase n=1 Tax=Vibrio chagasii TaxID=170679 RepID=UPI0038CD16C2
MIIFNKPKLAGNELEYIKQAIDNAQLAGDGPFTKLCESKLNSLIGSKATLLTHSCTAALEMAALLLDLGPNDEVIMPSYTFVSTANAVVLRGATPVFVDIKPDTLNINEELIEAAITPKTKAIFVVHYAGVVCNMDYICKIAKNHKLYVVEDAAQALSSSLERQAAGSFGDLSCFSFHETKNIISGEGGCLAINNEAFIERAEIIREKGTNRKSFYKGMVDKYTWADLGSSFVPSELMAAFLYAQLEHIDVIQSERLRCWDYYKEQFSGLEEYGFQLPSIPPLNNHNAHLFYILAENNDIRDTLIAKLKVAGITCPFHYVPLHLSPAGEKYCRSGSDLTITEDISSRLIRFPLYPGVSELQDKIVKDTIKIIRKL